MTFLKAWMNLFKRAFLFSFLRGQLIVTGVIEVCVPCEPYIIAGHVSHILYFSSDAITVIIFRWTTERWREGEDNMFMMLLVDTNRLHLMSIISL
jgi:hypothetical protein